ncbi:MAG: hypothetical protein K8S62_10275 [Candidatus Sabulitectum sp.]|nr:hypothetical protein [Candidatus Sabulitectum sp.]
MKSICFIFLVVTAICVADPNNVLLHFDKYAGYGNAVMYAIEDVWPGTTVTAVEGGDWVTFNSALASESFDVIILENWKSNSDACDWATLLYVYNVTDTRIFLADWRLNFGSTGVQDLMAAMGVSGAAVNATILPHYGWEPSHEICAGVSDWTQADPVLAIYSNDLTVTDASPVTGWTVSVTAGMAGICVANDGVSIISGYTPAYSVESSVIWENILEFMGEGLVLEQSTWADIKASF